jgi:hypothetical protein
MQAVVALIGDPLSLPSLENCQEESILQKRDGWKPAKQGSPAVSLLEITQAEKYLPAMVFTSCNLQQNQHPPSNFGSDL